MKKLAIVVFQYPSYSKLPCILCEVESLQSFILHLITLREVFDLLGEWIPGVVFRTWYINTVHITSLVEAHLLWSTLNVRADAFIDI